MTNNKLTNVDRKRIIQAYLSGSPVKEIADIFLTGYSTVWKIIKVFLLKTELT
jgi:transposase